MKFTIVGGHGFLGTEINSQLLSLGHQVYIPSRSINLSEELDLGILIYCAGNGNCNDTPFKVLDSNTSLLSRLLEKGNFKKLVYISSTRIYMNNSESLESSDINISYSDSRRLFNLTKLVSEELCKRSGKSCIVIRPSNIYGSAFNSNLFLPSIVRNAINDNHIDLYVSKDYKKDYVSVQDVAEVVIRLSLLEKNKYFEYNVGSGENIEASYIAKLIKDKTGCNVSWHDSVSVENFPETNISRVMDEFDYQPKRLEDELCKMIDSFKSMAV